MGRFPRNKMRQIVAVAGATMFASGCLNSPGAIEVDRPPLEGTRELVRCLRSLDGTRVSMQTLGDENPLSGDTDTIDVTGSPGRVRLPAGARTAAASEGVTLRLSIDEDEDEAASELREKGGPTGFGRPSSYKHNNELADTPQERRETLEDRREEVLAYEVDRRLLTEYRRGRITVRATQLTERELRDADACVKRSDGSPRKPYPPSGPPPEFVLDFVGERWYERQVDELDAAIAAADLERAAPQDSPS